MFILTILKMQKNDFLTSNQSIFQLLYRSNRFSLKIADGNKINKKRFLSKKDVYICRRINNQLISGREKEGNYCEDDESFFKERSPKLYYG